MAAVAVNQTGVFLHRSAIEAAEAQYLATGKTVKLTVGSKVSCLIAELGPRMVTMLKH